MGADEMNVKQILAVYGVPALTYIAALIDNSPYLIDWAIIITFILTWIFISYLIVVEKKETVKKIKLHAAYYFAFGVPLIILFLALLEGSTDPADWYGTILLIIVWIGITHWIPKVVLASDS